jgi:hypothetical protein
VHRRRFLATAALSTGALAASAGCLDAETRPSTARLGELWFVNAAEDGCDVSATVTDTAADGEPTVYETSFRLGPAPSDQDPVGNVTRDPGLDGPGAYVVEATVDGESLTVDTTEHVKGASDCVLAKFERSLGGTVHSVPLTYDRC